MPQRAARRRVGNTLAVREEVRASGWEHVVETVVADLRYGLRRLAGHPGFAFVTIATLGLGIGSVTAMLSVAVPVLVQTLPFPDERSHSRRLGPVPGWRARRDGLRNLSSRCRSGAAPLNRWRCRASGSLRLSGPGLPERLEGRGVSVDYFRVFGVAPRIGRDFTAARRQAQRAARGDAQRSPVAAPLCRRSGDHRPPDHARWLRL